MSHPLPPAVAEHLLSSVTPENLVALAKFEADVNGQTLTEHLRECGARRSELHHQVESLKKQLRETEEKLLAQLAEAKEVIRRLRAEKWQQRKESRS